MLNEGSTAVKAFPTPGPKETHRLEPRGSAQKMEPSVTEPSHREKTDYGEKEYHHEGDEGHNVKLKCENLRDLRVLRGKQVL